MPTVIDSLIVELKLDPSGFTAGQRQMAENLRRMEAQTATAAQRIGGNTRRSVQQFLAGFDEQFKQVNLNLDRVANQTRRSGIEIERAGRQGAYGLSNLATSALGAYAALKSVQGAVEGIGASTEKTVGTGRAAARTGLDRRWLTAFGQLVRQTQGTPEADTENALQEFEQKRQEWMAWGTYPQEFINLVARLGLDPQTPLPTLLQQIAAASRGRNGPEVLNLARSVGLGNMDLTFGLGAEGMQRGITENLKNIADPTQLQNVDQLWRAIQNVGIAIDNLKAKVQGANPEWTKWVNGWAKFITDLGNSKEGIESVTKAVEGLAFAIGVLLVFAIEKMGVALAASPLGRLLLAGYFLKELYGAAGDVATNPPTIPKGEKPKWYDDTDTYGILPGLVARGWNWLTGGSGGAGGAPSVAPGASATPSAAPGDDASLMDELSRAESRNQNINNSLYPTAPNYYTASGYWQITDGNWRKYAPRVGIDIGAKPRALNATALEQKRVKDLMQMEMGGAPWDVAHGGPMPIGWLPKGQVSGPRLGTAGGVDVNVLDGPDIGASGSSGSASQGHPLNRGFAVPPETKFNSKGIPYNPEVLNPAVDARVQQSMRAIRAAQAAGVAWNKQSSGTSISNDMDIHGGIHVYGTAENGYAKGSAVSDAIKNELLVNEINTGLQ